MKDNFKLSPDEITDLKLKFEKMAILFERDEHAFILFKASPLRYLRNSNLVVMEYIDNRFDPYFTRRFSYGILNILRNKFVFDRCLWCKISVLTVIYATCGKAGLALQGFREVISWIIEALQGILNESDEMIKHLVDLVNSLNDWISPYHMARLICAHLGYCPG